MSLKEKIIEAVEYLNDLDRDNVNKPEYWLEYDETYLYQKAHVGGSRGASCWNSDPSVPYRETDVKDSDMLELLLERVCPDVTFLGYRKMQRLVDEYEDDCYADYYGNYSTYRITRIDIDAMVRALNELGY